MIFKNNKVYDALVWIAQIFLPATGGLYVALAEIWGFPCSKEVAGTVLAIDTFLGALLKISNEAYKKEHEGE